LACLHFQRHLFLHRQSSLRFIGSRGWCSFLRSCSSLLQCFCFLLCSDLSHQVSGSTAATTAAEWVRSSTTTRRAPSSEWVRTWSWCRSRSWGVHGSWSWSWSRTKTGGSIATRQWRGHSGPRRNRRVCFWRVPCRLFRVGVIEVRLSIRSLVLHPTSRKSHCHESFCFPKTDGCWSVVRLITTQGE